MLRLEHIYLSLCLLLLIPLSLIAQEKDTVDTARTVRIDPRKPSIFLEFVRTGECRYAPTFTVLREKPCESTRTDITLNVFDAVWLRLVNNTRWAIVVDSRNIFTPPVVGPLRLADGRTVTAASDGGDIDVSYGVEAETGCDFHKYGAAGELCKMIDRQTPKVDALGVSTPVHIPPGKSIVFAVDRKHLDEYLMVYVLFHYEWETNDKAPSLGDPKHRVYFSYYGLDQGLKSKAKKGT